MKQARSFVLVLVLVLVLDGCASGGGDPAKPGTGSISGSVRARPKEGVRGPSSYESTPGAPQRLDYGRLSGIVVWLEGADPGPGTGATMKLGPKGFEPDVCCVSSGETLVLSNESRDPASIYAVGVFDAGTIPPGGKATVKATRSGPFEVLVEERDVKAHVYFAPGRRCAVLKSGEDFRWDGIAPGTFTVRAWHKRLPPAQTQATVSAGATAEVELDLSVNELPKAK